MPRPEAVERPAPLEEFMAELKRLREQAGAPSFRRMAATSGAVSHATLHLTITGRRLQPWETVREFVRACGGDEAQWHARWQEVSLALSEEQRRAVPADHDEPAATGPDPGEGGSGRSRVRRRPLWLLAPLAAAVALIAVVVVRTTSADGTESGAADLRAMVHEGDASKFLRDVTYPDGTVVKPDSQFVKVWEIRNTGSVEWRDRYLQRIDLPIGPDDCSTPERIPVNHTRPQQNVQITVTVRTPATAPVDCRVRWKMVDESGRMLMPGYRPIYFEVRVRE